MITLIVGSIILMSYFVDIPAIQESSDLLISWAVVISGFSLGLGAMSLVQVHSNKIRTKASRWPLSIWLLMVMGGTLAIGIVKSHQARRTRSFCQCLQRPRGDSVFSPRVLSSGGCFSSVQDKQPGIGTVSAIRTLGYAGTGWNWRSVVGSVSRDQELDNERSKRICYARYYYYICTGFGIDSAENHCRARQNLPWCF